MFDGAGTSFAKVGICKQLGKLQPTDHSRGPALQMYGPRGCDLHLNVGYIIFNAYPHFNVSSRRLAHHRGGCWLSRCLLLKAAIRRGRHSPSISKCGRTTLSHAWKLTRAQIAISSTPQALYAHHCTVVGTATGARQHIESRGAAEAVDWHLRVRERNHNNPRCVVEKLPRQ